MVGEWYNGKNLKFLNFEAGCGYFKVYKKKKKL